MGQPRLSWRDVWVVCTSAAPGSRLARELDPRAAWTVAEYLLATIADADRWLVWAKSKDGSKNRNRPKPITRPGGETKKRDDLRAMPVDQMRALLARPRVAEKTEDQPRDAHGRFVKAERSAAPA